MKQIEVQDGVYKGKLAIIVGTDLEQYGKSIMSVSEPIGRDYCVRWAHSKDWKINDKVYIANIDGQTVALNQRELAKPKKSQGEAKKEE